MLYCNIYFIKKRKYSRTVMVQADEGYLTVTKSRHSICAIFFSLLFDYGDYEERRRPSRSEDEPQLF